MHSIFFFFLILQTNNKIYNPQSHFLTIIYPWSVAHVQTIPPIRSEYIRRRIERVLGTKFNDNNNNNNEHVDPQSHGQR